MKTTLLKPFSQKALSSQLYNLTGKHYNSHDFTSLGLGRDTMEISTGNIFIAATMEQENSYKEKVKRIKAIKEHAKKHKFDHINYPFIDYNNPDRWKAGLNEAKKFPYKAIEMCEEAYYNFLECVFPKRMDGPAYVCGEPYTHNNKGIAIYLCGIERNNKFYAQYGTVKEFDQRKLFKNI